MATNIKFTFMLALVLTMELAAGSPTFAQEIIQLTNSKDELIFQGTGTHTINVVWQNCDTSGCRMEGSASKRNEPRSGGTYKFSSANARPFKLIGSSSVGLFSVEQSSSISFTYACPQGTVLGLALFTSAVENKGSITATLSGTLQVTGGTYFSRIPSSPGSLSLTIALGKNSLPALVNETRSIKGAINYLSFVAPKSP